MKIIIVDDNNDIRGILEEYLSGSGHTVSSFSNPQECLDTVEAIKPDAVVSDYEMPQMTGKEMLEKIPDIPKALFTGNLGLKVPYPVFQKGNMRVYKEIDDWLNGLQTNEENLNGQENNSG